MVSLLIAIVLQVGPNLVKNPGFVREWEGWAPLWSRKEGSATAQIVAGRSPSTRAAQISSSGPDDWSLAQSSQIHVQPGQIYRLSAWMKVDGGSGSISVVTRDAKGTTLQWTLGDVGPRQPGWQFVKRQIVVPTSCETIQFRIVGSQPGTTTVEAPALVLSGSKVSTNIAALTLKNASLSLRVNGDGSMLATTAMGRAWQYRAWPQDLAVKAIKKLDDRTAQIEGIDLANDRPLNVKLSLDVLAPEIVGECSTEGPLEENLSVPGSLITTRGQWIVLPMNEGIQFPIEDKAIDGWSLVTYGGHGLCMPWAGIYDPKSTAGTMTIVETPDDADVLFHHEDGRMTFQPRWEPCRQRFGYTRKLRYCFIEKGGYLAMAKRYRTYAKAHGLFKTLAQKKIENPNVDRLIGAVNVWNWDMDKVALCQEMKKLGFGRVLWSSAGDAKQVKAIADLGYLPGIYDIYQDVWDPKNSLSWQPTAGWPDDLVYEPNGQWMKGWSHPDKQPDGTIKWYQGGVICSSCGLPRAKTKIPADIAKNGYLARFIDTTTASPFRECYNPKHPLTRSQDRDFKMRLLSFCSKEMKQVVGTETGIDPSVPFIHYYEGMMSLGPYRLPDAGTFMMDYQKPTPDFLKYQVGANYRIPLWELVYHDCTVAQWYWGDATNKAPEVWNQRDLLNILYGTPPLLMFDKGRWDRDKMRMLQTYRNVCEWVRKVGYDEMLSHEYLAGDHSVQRTRWSSGRSVVVNFGDKAFGKVAPGGFLISTFR